MEISKEINQLRFYCELYFNDIKKSYYYFLPKKFQKYCVGGKKFNDRQIYFLIKELIKNIETYNKNKDIELEILVKNKEVLELNHLKEIYKDSRYFDYFIHGSYSDGTYTEESDIDDFILIKSEAFESFNSFLETKKILSKLNLEYQKIDPLQHHGHWIFTEYDLYEYDTSIMPISIFRDDNIFSVGKDCKLNIHTSKVNKNNIEKVYTNLKEEIIDGVNKMYKNKLNLYFLKNTISSITLLLPLAFQIRGNDLNKKEAIKESLKILDRNSVKVLDWSSEIRKNWRKLPSFKIVNYLKFLPNLFNRNISARLVSKILPNIGYKKIVNLEKKLFFEYIRKIDNYVYNKK